MREKIRNDMGKQNYWGGSILKKFGAISLCALSLIITLSSCQNTQTVVEPEETQAEEVTTPLVEEPIAEVSESPVQGLIDYTDYPGVLDFGAYAGLPIGTKRKNSFSYKDVEPSTVESYIESLKSNGFVGETNSGITSLKNDKYEVQIIDGTIFSIYIYDFDVSNPRITPPPVKTSTQTRTTPPPVETSNPNPTNYSTQTIGEKNALESAKSYLNVLSFSYSGLIDQLEFDGYSHSEAVYGADNCGANWNEQAALSAERYLNVMSFSRSGLIKQLEFDGFTYGQAVYGVEQNGY